MSIFKNLFRKRGEKIVHTIENKKWNGIIENKDLPEDFGILLVGSINRLHSEMVKQRMLEGYFTLEEMGKFYGNTLKVTIIRPAK